MNQRYELTPEEQKLIDQGGQENELKVRDMVIKRCPELRSREVEDIINDYIMLVQEVDHAMEYGWDA
jgi:hypothetical protein